MRNIMLAFVVLMGTLAFGQDYSKVELYGGVQYRHTDVSEFANTAGFNTSGTYFVVPRLGATVEVSGNYSDGKSAETFMAGPTFRVGSIGPLQVEAHALFGDERASLDYCHSTYVNHGFAMAFGGSVDYSVTKHLSIRLADVDYLRTDHFNTSENSVRVSSGLVLKF